MKLDQLHLVHKNNNSGFSLIEMVITVGIIAIIIVALATMGIFTLKKASESNNKSRALRFAQEAVEAIRYYRDVDQQGFKDLTNSTDTGVGNYIIIMSAVPDTGWQLKTTKNVIGAGVGTATQKENGCQDPVKDDETGVFISTTCANAVEPYFKRKIEVINIDTVNKGNTDFRITVWWENGNDTGIVGKKVVITTTLSR